jgi:hypothetical protein
MFKVSFYPEFLGIAPLYAYFLYVKPYIKTTKTDCFASTLSFLVSRWKNLPFKLLKIIGHFVYTGFSWKE